MAYVDYTYYTGTYGGSTIPTTAFTKYENKAERKVNADTFGEIIEAETYMDDVKKCTCEVAEEFYIFENAKSDNGMVLKSFSNDGESGTFDESFMTEDAVSKRIGKIVKEWLVNTGLLYRGCNSAESKLQAHHYYI